MRLAVSGAERVRGAFALGAVGWLAGVAEFAAAVVSAGRPVGEMAIDLRA